MADFAPTPGLRLPIGASVFEFLPHPLFGQDMAEVFVIEGGEALVYQMRDLATGQFHALKVHKPSYRGEPIAQITTVLAQYAHIPGLLLANRLCLTAQAYPQLIAAYPSLEYAVVMPWLPGRSWAGLVADRQASQYYGPLHALPLAAATAQVLWELEAHHLAHCDIAGPNVFIRPDGRGVELLDVENLYIPHSAAPHHRSHGSPGYQHRRLGRDGQYRPDGDRFAGAILLAEMLSWWDPRVRELTPDGSESIFQPPELQEVGHPRWERVRDAVWATCPPALQLFDQAWASSDLSECPELGAWALTLVQSQQSA